MAVFARSERSEVVSKGSHSLRGRAGGVATKFLVDKTPRPTSEGTIFAPAKIVPERMPLRRLFFVVLFVFQGYCSFTSNSLALVRKGAPEGGSGSREWLSLLAPSEARL